MRKTDDGSAKCSGCGHTLDDHTGRIEPDRVDFCWKCPCTSFKEISMRTLEQIANEPQPGDEVAFTGGKIVYRVQNVTIGPDPVTRLATCTLQTEREETLRATPDQMDPKTLMLTVDPSVLMKRRTVLFHGQGWADLVRYGACSAGSFPVPSQS